MKIKLFKPIAYVLILSLGVMVTLTSCEKEPEAMELPPAESLVIDWDMFPTGNTKSVADVEYSANNWWYSFGSVVIWNSVVAVNIAIPTVAYAAAFNHDPVYLGDNSWEWSYSVPLNNDRTIEASLVGSRIDNETFSMVMTLSETGNFEEFRWFEGVIRYDHTAADWTLSHSPGNPVDYLSINYTKDFEAGEANIRYTVIDAGNEHYNSFIEYGIDPVFDYDAYYTISRSDTTTNIEWNTETHAGRVKDLRHFEDELWHCWDTMLQDVTCPE